MKTFLKYFLTFLIGIVVGLAGLFVVVLIIIASTDFSKEKPEIPSDGILKITLPIDMEEKGSD